ncbi:uncharacterized protein EI97DRAFT_383846 [Westerdykella ornata]|uniref:Cyclin n=1 Tax=Westerdykella ornata TaxID=318751 RepID=A0A6A6JDS3_WESOR|nr:uncharacterized protein EI97DRAFT_383846 [Westerdykella ornata]KAF2273339.1 hypothetical protein EI97DRAFT_383846 [Westerdykella ornata]
MIGQSYLHPSGNASPQAPPYASSLSSASSLSTASSAESIFSAISSSQESVSSCGTTHSSVSGSDTWSYPGASAADYATIAPLARVSTFPQAKLPTACGHNGSERYLPPLRTDVAVPVPHRQHPRRSSTLGQRPPPQLVRQTERKLNFVDCLVDSATEMVQVIWPLSDQSTRCDSVTGRGVLPLRTYIQETLRRSRTSYSTLQVALYYLILIKPHVPKHDFTMEQALDANSYRALQCGRRMFLAALILASKYLQDRNYSAKAWSKMSGLNVCEINTNEKAFLEAVNWKLHITDPIWKRWQEVVLRYTPRDPPTSPGASAPNMWKTIIPYLTPDLDIVVPPSTPVSPVYPEFKPALPRLSPLSVPDERGSQGPTSTPMYQLPPYLEPKPDLVPPTPPRVHLGPLPTPCLTPLSAGSATPAASGAALSCRRPSMRSAIEQAQSCSMARSYMDQFTPSMRKGLEAYHFPTRRPSIAPSTSSLTSSPESMVTDNSRSSRASSISSVSSAGLALHRPRLARLAANCNLGRRCAVLAECKEKQEEDTPQLTSSPPDLGSFHISDAEEPMALSGDSQPVSGGVTGAKRAGACVGRKRGRSSVDLQRNVRALLNNCPFNKAWPRAVDAEAIQDSAEACPSEFLAVKYSKERTPVCETKGLQSPVRVATERRRPLLKEMGSKRTCASEAGVLFGEVTTASPVCH